MHALPKQLMDVSQRNRLLNTPVRSVQAKQLRIRDELFSDAWGYKRVGPGIRGTVEHGIERALVSRKIAPASRAAPRWLVARKNARKTPPVRDRSGAPKSVREVATLPPTEVAAAVREAVEANVSIVRQECAAEVARMFGYARTSKPLQALVVAATNRLIDSGRLTESGGELRLP